MAEKRVSVRFVAEGGRVLRAELEGIGEAAGRGVSRLKTEMKAADAQLAALGRRAGLALAAVTAATVATGAALVRSSLQTVDGQAKLAQSLGTTVESMQVLTRAAELAGINVSGLEQGTKDLTRRLSQAAAGTGPAVAALERLGLSAAELIAQPLDRRIATIRDALDRFVPKAEQAAVAGQLFGEEASIAFARLDGATIRTATEDLRRFGVVVSEVDGEQIERTRDALSRLALIGTGLGNRLAVAVAPGLERMADALARAAELTGPLGRALTFVTDNLDRIAAYAGAFAAVLAGRFVAGAVAAAASVRGLALALVVLKGAVARTGIGLLAVGLGEVAYRFTMVEGFALAATATFNRWAAAALDAVAGAGEAVAGFADRAVAVNVAAARGIAAALEAIPRAAGDVALRAANAMIGGVEAMLNGVTGLIDAFTGRINAALDALPDWARPGGRIGGVGRIELGRIDNPFAGAIDPAAAAGAAARDALTGRYVTAPDLGLRDTAQGLRDLADTYDLLGRVARDSGAAMKDGLNEGETGAGEVRAVLTEVVETAEQLAPAAAAGGAALRETAEVVRKGWAVVADSLSSYARDAMDWAANMGEALVGAFRGGEGAIRRMVESGRFDLDSLRQVAASLLADIAMVAIRARILGPLANSLGSFLGGMGGGPGAPLTAIPGLGGPGAGGGGFFGGSFEGGGFTGTGARAGGLDGRGGFLAMLHPRETVIDHARGGAGQVIHFTMNVQTRDAESFRQSRVQIGQDMRRALALAGRG